MIEGRKKPLFADLAGNKIEEPAIAKIAWSAGDFDAKKRKFNEYKGAQVWFDPEGDMGFAKQEYSKVEGDDSIVGEVRSADLSPFSLYTKQVQSYLYAARVTVDRYVYVRASGL